MKLKNSQVAFSAVLTVVMVMFLSAIFFASADLSFAASGKKKSTAIARTSAVEYTEKQIKQLQGSLKITEAQKEPWNNLTQVMRDNAKEMDALNKERAESAGTLNSVERLKFHVQITEAHLAQLKKFIPPFETFYASLSDEQKATTDTIFMTGKHGPGKHKRK
jgi:hypothetical protein